MIMTAYDTKCYKTDNCDIPLEDIWLDNITLMAQNESVFMGIIEAFWDEDIFLSQDNYLENGRHDR